jgi:site-specific DNA-methyltransferase (adenine-specific)
MFPEELPRRLIKMFSFSGETVLDPFAGSGTTATVAKELGRSSVSYEINLDFIPLISTKFNVDDLQVIDSNALTEELLTDRISKLPYKFVDVQKLEIEL